MRQRLAVLLVTATVAFAILPIAGAEAASSIQFRRLQYDSPGPDNRTNASLNAEYFQLRNVGTRTVNLAGWYVRDAAGHTYKFTTTFNLRPGYTVTVRTGKGTNTSANRYWGSGAYIWNNTGDKAYLRNRAGTLMDSCSWSSVGAGYKNC